jgi:hypothetical protein
MNMDKAFSIRNPLQGELLDFVQASGFECRQSLEFVRDLTCLLANYREEDVPVYPDVFVALSNEALTSIAPGTQRIPLGRAPFNSAAERVLKNCATLAVRGWAIYVVKIDTNLVEFGVFRSLMH